MEKAQELKSTRRADAGYRCRRCGQPKRGHICPAKMRGGPQVDLPTQPPGGLMLGVGGDQPQPLMLPDLSEVLPVGAPRITDVGVSSGFSQPSLKRTRSPSTS